MTKLVSGKRGVNLGVVCWLVVTRRKTGIGERIAKMVMLR